MPINLFTARVIRGCIEPARWALAPIHREGYFMRVRFFLILFIGLAWTLSAEGATQAHIVQVVHQAPTTTTVLVNGAPNTGTNMVSLSMQVVSTNGLVVPNGAISISDGDTVLGAFGVASGMAGGVVSIASAGTHLLIGCYLNTDNYAPSCSAPVAVTLTSPSGPGSPTSPLPPTSPTSPTSPTAPSSPTPPTSPAPPTSPTPPSSPAPPTSPAPPSSPTGLYQLQQGTASSVIDAPHPFIDKLSVIPSKNFVGVVQLSCRVSAYKCELSPSSLTFSGDGKTQTIQVSFIPSATALGGLFGLSIFGVVGVRSKRYPISKKLILIVAVCTLIGLAGCGPTIAVPFGAENYTMLVSSSSGTYSQAVTYQIRVDTAGTKP